MDDTQKVFIVDDDEGVRDGLSLLLDTVDQPCELFKDAREFPKLTQRLIAEGYKPDEIEKIWGGNVLRVLQEGWGNRDSSPRSE